MVCVTMWFIWYERNLKIHKGKKNGARNVLDRASVCFQELRPDFTKRAAEVTEFHG